MKKFFSYLIRFTLFLSVIIAMGLFALTSSKPAISETPKIKLQRGVQQLDTNEPSQLIEMMAKDLHDKQVKSHTIMKEAVENMNPENPEAEVAATEEESQPEPEEVMAATEPVKAVKKIEEINNSRLGDIDASETSAAPVIKTNTFYAPWGKTMLSLVFVISLIGVLAAVVKKYLLPMQSQKSINHFGGSIQILQSMVIGLKQQIMVVLVEGHRLVIGVSENGMNLLYTIPNSSEVREATEASAPQEVIRPVATAQSQAFSATMEKAEPKRAAAPAPVFSEENIQDLQDDPLAKVVSHTPQDQFTDHAFRKKLEAFERYQADQAHIASLREKVREQMAAFSQRRETGEPVSNNVSQKIRAAMRSMKSFNNQQQDRGNAY